MMKLQASHVYSIIGFMTSLANATMFTTYAVYQVIALGLNPLQLLLVGMVLEVTVLVFEGITGVMADVYGRRRSVITGMFVLGFGFLLEGCVLWLAEASPLLSAFMWLLLAQVVFGIGATFISGADMAWIVDEVGEESAGRIFLQAKRIGLFGTLAGIALSVGLSAIRPNLPYVTGGVMYVLLGVFLIFAMKETKFAKAVNGSQAVSHWSGMKAAWLSGTRVIRGNPLLLMILIVTIFSGAASEGYDRLWQAYLIVDVGLPPDDRFAPAVWFGLLAVLSTMLSLVAVWIAEKRIDMSSGRVAFRGMIVLTAARIASVLGLAFSSDFAGSLAAVLLYDVVRTLSGPMYDTWLNLNIDGKSRATVLSMMSQSDALGQTAGGPFVGWIGSRFSIRASLVAAAVLLSPIMGVYARVLRKR